MRKRVTKRKTFDSLIVLVGWQIWLKRNARTFNNKSATTTATLTKIRQEKEQWCLAKLIKPELCSCPMRPSRSLCFPVVVVVCMLFLLKSCTRI